LHFFHVKHPCLPTLIIRFGKSGRKDIGLIFHRKRIPNKIGLLKKIALRKQDRNGILTFHCMRLNIFMKKHIFPATASANIIKIGDYISPAVIFLHLLFYLGHTATIIRDFLD